MPETDWFVCPMEPRVRHLVSLIVDGDEPRPALCQVESPAWIALHETAGTSRPCPLCAAVVTATAHSGLPRAARSDKPPLPWGQPGDVRGR